MIFPSFFFSSFLSIYFYPFIFLFYFFPFLLSYFPFFPYILILLSGVHRPLSQSRSLVFSLSSLVLGYAADSTCH